MATNQHTDDVNRDREYMAFGEAVDWDEVGTNNLVNFRWGKYGHYDPLTVDTARALIDAGHIDRNQRQNYSPTVEEMVAWGEEVESEYADVSVHYEGYMVGERRPDTRISFTAILVAGDIPSELLADAREEFGGADEIHVESDYMSFWWD